ncbi:DMT family transporter [Puniceibacterium sp. IMCC21224]|uniref:DMT family transporter n=1 Tax=Puniceibacterium sp. IMCC21224 TaxID=1618204 RepID=UPI00064D748A|nr:DMT family transporter [Puniceibacterium sp. IMCC21224]KMK68518.1 putative permease, DMT superfamily [Puniceibacterium sp. IMCC21224]
MDLRAIAMGLVFAAMWSSAFTSARIIVAAAPPLQSLGLRFLVSGLIAVAIARAMGQSWHLTRRQWRSVVVFGICQNALYLGMNFIAMQTVQASLAAIIASTMPLMVALAGWVIFRDRMGALGIVGLLIGVLGVVLIMGARLRGGVDLYGLTLCILGGVSLAAATLSMRGATSGGGNVMMIVGLQMLVGAGALVVPALAFESFEVQWSWSLIIAFWYTTLIPGVAATLIWFLLVERIGAVKAATFHFLNPFFGVAIAAALLGEALGIWDVIGVVVIALGILAVQLSRQRAA